MSKKETKVEVFDHLPWPEQQRRLIKAITVMSEYLTKDDAIAVNIELAKDRVTTRDIKEDAIIGINL